MPARDRLSIFARGEAAERLPVCSSYPGHSSGRRCLGCSTADDTLALVQSGSGSQARQKPASAGHAAGVPAWSGGRLGSWAEETFRNGAMQVCREHEWFIPRASAGFCWPLAAQGGLAPRGLRPARALGCPGRRCSGGLRRGGKRGAIVSGGAGPGRCTGGRVCVRMQACAAEHGIHRSASY